MSPQKTIEPGMLAILLCYFKDLAALNEVERLTNAAYKVGKKNYLKLNRASVLIDIEVRREVGDICALGALLFLGVGTALEKHLMARAGA